VCIVLHKKYDLAYEALNLTTSAERVSNGTFDTFAAVEIYLLVIVLLLFNIQCRMIM
jgi:hypothetical protein